MPSTATAHVMQIESALKDADRGARHNAICRSWRRSVDSFGIDPTATEEPRVLSPSQLSELRDRSELFITAAQPEIDRLYQIVRPARYVVLLTDPDGAVIDHRGADEDAEEFKRWGIWLGRDWSETAEGTNGIGTAILDGCPTTVHRSQHFRVRHIDLSCSGAPTFDPDGKLLGIVDVSSFDPNLSEHAHSLTGALTVAVARGIEERLFRARFHEDWIIAIARPDIARLGMLLAVNDMSSVIGANRDARGVLAAKGFPVADGVKLWALFERNDSLFRRKNSGDVSGSLICRENGQQWPAIVTPPLPPALGKFRLQAESLFWRPRLDALLAGHLPARAEARIGLAPAALRRVRDHIEAHLDGDLSLRILAGVAGLSVSHFARGFKHSEGRTPHAFVLDRRLNRARQLLIETDLSLSEIAFAVGFADQSHLARRFRRQLGVAPNEFRRSQAPN